MVLVVFIALIVGGLVLIAALALPLAIVSMSRDEKGRKEAEADAPALLDAAFDGRPDAVVKVEKRGLSYETTVLGAKNRGYRLLSANDEPGGDKTLVFTKD